MDENSVSYYLQKHKKFFVEKGKNFRGDIMLEDYLMLHKSILPEYFEKVIKAKHLLDSGKAADVSQAVKMVGISRSTYYKYKDYVLEPAEMAGERKAVLSVLLAHEPGILSALLAVLSEEGGSVLTITQSMPIHNSASVTITLDVSGMDCSMSCLLQRLGEMPGVDKPKLIAIE